MQRSRILPAILAVGILALTGCSSATGTAATGSPGSNGKIAVVASTNVYGQIASEVGGDHVDVTSIIASTSQDPHEFEATASDQLTVKRAQLLIENGGGYDPFLDSLVKAAGSSAPMITAVTYSDAWKKAATNGESAQDGIDGFNEHVFYDLATMKRVADAVAEQLGSLDAADAAEFTANAAALGDRIGKLEDQLATIAAAHDGEKVFVTEPLPLYLTAAAGLSNATPPEFSEAVEEGQDVPPATLLQALGLIDDRSVSVVITNAQAGGAETTQVQQHAEAQSIPVLSFSEILPESTTYVEWMQDNVDALAKALQ